MSYPRQPKCRYCERAVREDGLCRSHAAQWKRSGLSLDEYLRESTLPGPGTAIPGFDPDRYRIFREGSVWSRGRGGKKWKKLPVDLHCGIASVILPDAAGTYRRHPLAALVLRAFIGPRPIGCVPFLFPDPNPLNCSTDNLRWVPRGTVKLGRDPIPGRHRDQRGDLNPFGKLTESVIPLIRSLYRSGSPVDAIAAEFGVSASTIRLILKGKTWSHVPDLDGPIAMRADANRGTDISRAKLDELAVLDIRARRADGETLAALAASHGVSIATVHSVVTGRSWSHVMDEKER